MEGKTNLVFDRLRNNFRQNVWLAGKGKGSFYRQETEGLEGYCSFKMNIFKKGCFK